MSRFNIIDKQEKFSMGGSTSLRNNSKDHLIWKEQGYFQRNRDLGQVFYGKEDFQLKSIIVRTGPSDKAILENTPGSKIFLQIFEVLGNPEINDNQTGTDDKASHGYTANHRGDDFIIGVEYRPLKTYFGGIFPEIEPTFVNQSPNQNEEGKLHYIRLVIKEDPLVIQKAKRYAFILGFEEEGENLGFTLANHNGADHKGNAVLDGPGDPYPLGWGIRREGNGNNPPEFFPGNTSPTEDNEIDLLYEQSLFPPLNKRLKMEPTTDGYPDVDTYRDLEFYIESWP